MLSRVQMFLLRIPRGFLRVARALGESKCNNAQNRQLHLHMDSAPSSVVFQLCKNRSGIALFYPYEKQRKRSSFKAHYLLLHLPRVPSVARILTTFRRGLRRGLYSTIPDRVATLARGLPRAARIVDDSIRLARALAWVWR